MFVEAAGELASHSRTSYPSGVSWSADGQFLVLTHAYLHILTPSLGLCVREDRAALSGLPGNRLREQWVSDKSGDDFEAGECSGLPIFKTSITAQRRRVEWDQYTTDSRLTTSGMLDNGWRMASWSPSGLSQLGRCVLATLDLNREVSIYAATTDAIKSNWEQVFDLTAAYIAHLHESYPELLDDLPNDTPDMKQARRNKFVIMAQATSVAWSPAGPVHAFRDDSLLAVCFTSGELTLWRHEGNGSMTMVFKQGILSDWPVLSSWSSWNIGPDTGLLSCHIAVSGTSETVILEITQDAPRNIVCNVVHTMRTNGRTATLLKWLDGDRLLVGRLGELAIWTRSSLQSLPIAIEDFKGWTSLSAPTDVITSPSSGQSILALGDGTLRSIEGLYGDAPTLQPLGKGGGPSYLFSDDFRDAFMAIDRAGGKGNAKSYTSSTSAMILGGLTGLDDDGTIFWTYEKHQLDRKLYQMANLHKFYFALARFAVNFSTRFSVDERIRKLMTSSTDTGAITSSSKTLFPLFLTLRNLAARRESLSSVHSVILDSLDLQSVAHPTEATHSQADILHALGDVALQRLRYASLLLRFIESISNEDDLSSKCRSTVQRILVTIYAMVYGLFSAFVSTGTQATTELTIRYSALVHLLAQVRETYEHDDDDLQSPRSTVAESLPSVVDRNDKCAACGHAIVFDTLGKATCESGHNWVRCCITLQVMSTSAARTCTSCGRKSQVPQAVEADDDGAQKVLKMANYCLFCGGRWNR